jgi:hypothetical protein
MPSEPLAERNGWRLYVHPAFGDAFEGLSEAVQELKREHPKSYAGHPKAKLLKRILDLILDEIPRVSAWEYIGSGPPALAEGEVPGTLSALLSIQRRPQGDHLLVGKRRIDASQSRLADRSLYNLQQAIARR